MRTGITVGSKRIAQFTPVPTGLLQRACACGQHTGGGECKECRRKKADSASGGFLQRVAVNRGPAGEVPPIVYDVLRSPGRPLDAATRAFFEPRFGYDFSHVPSNIREHSSNGSEDEQEEESVNLQLPLTIQPPTQLQPVVSCPVSTRVDNTTNLTQAGLQAGFLSAYGIIARMRVVPDRTTWDGRQVIESVTPARSTCPSGLTRPGPCQGNSSFTVGAASGGSGVIPRQPAMRNRFYDFHTSRSRSISFLHDPTRNPTGMNSCEAVCQQEYSCRNIVIGTHHITRQFRKGTFNGRNVTIIDVTKQDLVSEPGDFPVRTLPPGQEYAGLASEPGPGELA